MDELTFHPDPAAPAAGFPPRPRREARVPRAHPTPHLGESPIPASDPAITGSSPRVYAYHFPSGTQTELARGVSGAQRMVCREQRLLGANYHVWAEYRSRRMILPR